MRLFVDGMIDWIVCLIGIHFREYCASQQDNILGEIRIVIYWKCCRCLYQGTIIREK